MKATVLLEKIGPRKYRASTTQPVVLESEGTSRRQALDRLSELVRKRLAGAQLVQITLPGKLEANPWKAFAGIWKDHPDFNEFADNVAEYRRSARGIDSAS
jgi:hypothetical protein